MNALPPPTAAAGDPFAASLPPPSLSSPPPPPSSSSSLNLSPSLLIIAALLAFVFFASVSIHFLLRCLARASSSHPSPSPLPVSRARRASEADEAGSARRSAAAVAPEEEAQAAVEVDDEKEKLIASLPLFTMASALAALPKSSPDCAVCLSPFTPDAELRLLPACRHAFHAACVDAWLRTTPSCPLCRAAVSLPHPPLFPTATAGPDLPPQPLDARVSSSGSNNNSRSFRVEIGSVSNRRGSSAAGDDRRTYSLGSFDYRVDEEVEAVVSRITHPAAAVSAAAAAAKSATQQQQEAPATPGEALAEAAGSRGWLREYVDRLASSASSLSGRWSARWSQGHGHSARWSQGHGHHSRSQSQSQRPAEDSWRWDPEVAAGAAMHRAPDEEEPGFVALYRWIVGV